jgi:hypothetical protein
VIRLFAIVDVQFLEDHVQLSVHAHEHLPEESELLTSRVISSAPEQAHMLTSQPALRNCRLRTTQLAAQA